MVENFPDLVGYKPTGSRSCSEQMTNRINLKKSLPRHIIIELLETKNKEKILKVTRENNTLVIEDKQWERQQQFW